MIALVEVKVKGNGRTISAEVVGSLQDKQTLLHRVCNKHKVPMNKRHLMKIQEANIIRIIEQ